MSNLKILYLTSLFIILFTIICASDDTSVKYIPDELKGVYIGMSLEEFNAIRTNATEERWFGDKTYFEKVIGSKLLESAAYYFDKQLHLKYIRLGNLFRTFNKDEMKNRINEYLEYSIAKWGKNFKKTIWINTVLDKKFELPCLYWQKNDIKILMDISFYSKEQSSLAPTGCHVCIFDRTLTFENISVYGIQVNPPSSRIENIFKLIPDLDKITKDTIYIEKEDITLNIKITNENKYAIFSQDIREYDLGKINKNEKVKTVISFKNTGNAPLEIYNIEADCFCTIAEIENKIIKMNETGKILVEFNSKGKKGKQKHSMAIYTNDKNNSKVIFTIIAEVKE